MRGDVFFAGRFRPKGVYQFSSHSGDVRLRLPRETGARVESRMVSGHLITSMPLAEMDAVELRRPRRDRLKQYRFRLGSGDAQLQLETFQGNIELEWLENARLR